MAGFPPLLNEGNETYQEGNPDPSGYKNQSYLGWAIYGIAVR